MKQIVIFAVVLLVVGIVVADDSPLTQVAERLSKIAEDIEPVASVTQDGRTVTLSYNTRKFMVHNTNKLGQHSEKARETIGPRYDGLIVKITIQDGKYFGAAMIPQDIRHPYWTTFVNAFPIAKGKQHLHANISYGNRTDRETIKKIKAMLAAMVDDDPNIKVRKIESHNQKLDPTVKTPVESGNEQGTAGQL